MPRDELHYPPASDYNHHSAGEKMIFKDMLVWLDDPNKKALPEYQTREIDDNTIECWVPSTEGMNFEIRYIPMPWLNPGFDIRCIPRLDGVDFRSHIVRAWEIKEDPDFTCKGVTDSSSTRRLFCFQNRVLTDREDVAPSHGSRDELNSIRLTFEWGRAGKAQIRTDFTLPKETGPIHEKAAKKGHAGAVGLGSATKINYTPRATPFAPEAGLGNAVFIFRYGPEDWLQARDIIPSENPSSLKRERSITPEVVDLDELETDDDDIVILKHLVPAPEAPSQKRQKVKDRRREVEDEEDVKPKLES